MDIIHILIISNATYVLEKEKIQKTSLDEFQIDEKFWYDLHSVNIEDYDIIFLDYPEKLMFDYDRPFRNFKLSSEFNSEQLYFIIASKCNIFREYSNKNDLLSEDIIHTLWKDIPESIYSKGKKVLLINPNQNISKLLFDIEKIRFSWQWSIRENQLLDISIPLAKNKKGDIISLIWKDKNRIFIILPHPNYKVSYITHCITYLRTIKDELLHQSKYKTLKKPEWLKDYDLFGKKEMIQKRETIEKEINQIQLYEILLYGYGIPLEDSIEKIFIFLGFKNITRSLERADLIFETETTRFIAEIKGLKKTASEKNTQQMFKWFTEDLNVNHESERRKLIFICNAQREIHPSERNSFFHYKVIEYAEFHHWGLLSTLELYNALLKIRNNELSKEDVIFAIESKVGVIKF